MRQLLFLILPALFLPACADFFEQTVEVDPPEYDRQLVLHEYLVNTDTQLILDLSRNTGIFDPVGQNELDVTGATIVLTPEGEPPVAVLPVDLASAVYRATVAPGIFQPGKKFTLTATHPDFPEVTASQTVLPPPAVDSVVFRLNGGINNIGDDLSAFDIYVNDPPGEENYYEFILEGGDYAIFEVVDPDTGEMTTDTIVFYWYQRYPDLENNVFFEPGVGAEVFISDALFNGENFVLTLHIFRYSDPAIYRVRARAVTREHYLHRRSLARWYEAQDNPLAEPVTIFSNLQNGLGAFTISTEKILEVR